MCKLYDVRWCKYNCLWNSMNNDWFHLKSMNKWFLKFYFCDYRVKKNNDFTMWLQRLFNIFLYFLCLFLLFFLYPLSLSCALFLLKLNLNIMLWLKLYFSVDNCEFGGDTKKLWPLISLRDKCAKKGKKSRKHIKLMH